MTVSAVDETTAPEWRSAVYRSISLVTKIGEVPDVLATCAVSRVPWSWGEQLAVGGRVLVDLKVHAVVGNLVLLHRLPDRFVDRFVPGRATSMHIRSPLLPTVAGDFGPRDRQTARHRLTTDGDREGPGVTAAARTASPIHTRPIGQGDFGGRAPPGPADAPKRTVTQRS